MQVPPLSVVVRRVRRDELAQRQTSGGHEPAPVVRVRALLIQRDVHVAAHVDEVFQRPPRRVRRGHVEPLRAMIKRSFIGQLKGTGASAR